MAGNAKRQEEQLAHKATAQAVPVWLLDEQILGALLGRSGEAFVNSLTKE
jgi:hypothetical protein